MQRKAAPQSLLGAFVRASMARSGDVKWEVRQVKVIESAVCEVPQLVIRYVAKCLVVPEESLKVLGPRCIDNCPRSSQETGSNGYGGSEEMVLTLLELCVTPC